VVDGWTIGSDIGVMLTGVAVLPTAAVWLTRQARDWRAIRNRRSRLLPGQSLLVGESLFSPDGRTRFTLQSDANMTVTVDGYGVIDDTGTVGAGIPNRLTLEKEDGWLVLYNVDGECLWRQGPGGTRFEVQDNAHVVLYPDLGRAIWATDWLLMRGQVLRHISPGTSEAPANPLSEADHGKDQ
jgi:hypothetical protein